MAAGGGRDGAALARWLRDRLSGAVVASGDIGYRQARRVWNGAIDRYPSAVVRCATVEDVASSVRVLRGAGVGFTVRGGGHNVAGNAVQDGAVVLDLAPLRQVRFDPGRSIVTVGGGCVWGDVERPAADLDCVVPTGMISHTGVAGLTLGGGAGYLTRQLGTTSDSLLAADVVLADGSMVQASEADNPDLFWAVRGAGHNFGAVTRFTFRTHPLTAPVYLRQSIFDSGSRAAVLRFFREWAPSQPRQLTSYLNLLRVPPFWPWLRAAPRGQPAINVTSVWYGSADRGALLTDGLHRLAPALWTRERVIRHVELQHACDDDWRYGVHHYWKPAFLSGIPDPAVEAILDWCDRAPATYEQARSRISPQPINHFEINYRGGALADADPATSAYSDRTSPYNSNVQAVWTAAEDADECVSWATGFAAALAPYWAGAYTNFMSEAGSAAQVRRIFGEQKYRQLVAVKQRYDPDNVFASGGLDLTPARPEPPAAASTLAPARR